MSTDQSERALPRPLYVSLLVVLFNACIACLSNTGATILLSAPASSQTVKVDVSMSNQTLEGWGTSLAWFANSVGSWTNSTNQNNLMNALFSPTSGLGLNYLRYNIGGGDDPRDVRRWGKRRGQFGLGILRLGLGDICRLLDNRGPTFQHFIWNHLSPS